MGAAWRSGMHGLVALALAGCGDGVRLLAQDAATVSPAATQDATATLPDNYKLVFGNDRVRVVHVHYGPRELVPMHTHPGLPMLWVYLNDAGPVRFKHRMEDNSAFSVTRPPVHTGDMRLGAGHDAETHSVRNLADTATDFLRIEFLAIAPGTKGLHGRFAETGEEFRAEGGRVVAFDHPRLQVVRWAVAAGQTRTLDDRAATVWVAVDPQGATVQGVTVASGQVWATGPVQVQAGAGPAEFLEVIER